MNIKTAVTGYVSENCYITAVNRTLYIIDPGADPEKISDCMEELKDSADRMEILLTHAHADHIGAAGALCKKYDISAVRLAKEDIPIYRSPDNAFPPYIPLAEDLPETCNYEQNDDYRVIPCPGHTPGGVSLLFDNGKEKHLFTGDTLFAGSIGRTDFEGGDINVMRKTLRSLCTLDDDIIIHPGHGPSSTIGIEKSTNSYL
ncbi:MAG: MBL fold metallo-hydrolase [Lentisphaerae bacterium]|nr:MBL fold metallo-hydrolase [Lentisphaerota bacterium]